MVPCHYMYRVVAIAGTFDHLHKGHEFFISEAFKVGKKVMIGLTSDRFANAKISNIKAQIQIQNFQIRKEELEKFLRVKNLLKRAEIVKIEDVYGPAISASEIEALAVTNETLEGAQKVNRKRKELGLRLLKILKLPLILAEDKKRIASTRIRIGEINRWGKAFAMQFTNYQLPITNELRSHLKKPLGLLIKGNANNLSELAYELKKSIGKINSPLISTVGDEVTKVCYGIGIKANLSIVDLHVQRVRKYSTLEDLGLKNYEQEIIKVKNPPGHITNELVNAVKDAYSGIITDGRQRIIEVAGEEDLAGVPAVLLAPLGSLILYGQPGEGVVMVEVTEEKKEKLMRLIEQYKP